MSDNIKVVVKVRPLISREIEEKLSYQWRVKNDTLYQLDQNGRESGQYYTFDKVYDKDTQTSDVYNDIAKPIVEAATAGINGTIFAYGQTSSGKTYTMTGTDSSPGIIPLAVLNLFEIIKNAPDRDFLVRVSYLEIYNETVKDLLNPEKDNIKIHESFNGIKVDVGEKVTSSPEEVLEAMKEGEANRQKGATNMNELSSRSHSIFQITIESREHVEGGEQAGSVNVSQLNLVDLAGSERAGQTGATGLRFKEGTHINKSLSSLALVIKQLSEDPNKYANYRDSKLTRILQNSLGGNAKTSIICAVTPAAVEETISTLQFANRAKAIKNKPKVNAVDTDASMIQSLTKQMSKLQAQLESKKNLEQDNYKLQKQITLLQKLILNGFGQRRSEPVGGSRRQVQQPRRITISAFHSLDKEEEVLPIVPKFCTPSLKYNPNLIPNPVDFVPISSSNKLPSVPEEPTDRLTTPPPQERKVNFNDEVIEIDSDDDSTQEDSQTCSPYHTCQGASKTPPCVLRKNARSAEKHLKDILELTEREKMYKPSVNELLVKIEKNVAVITDLKDEVESLRQQSLKKDSEMDELKKKIKESEEDIKAVTSEKMEMKTKCDTYDIKLTDWEVSFETLKNKARLREEELLSLLEEMKVRKVNDISKQLVHTIEEIPFMDSSKEISLVNSDNENSVKDKTSDQICDLISDTQTQSNNKNQTIIELEANLFAHKQKIVSLENLTSELQNTVSSFKEKLANMENENSLLKSSIDNLNSTINNQKTNLESAHNDIESYNSVIQELQIKLTQKENVPNFSINDSVIENMIANEEKFLANNENMKNIIQCLKNVLDSRNKEINQLKSTLQTNDSSNNNNSLESELDIKTKQIDTLKLEVDHLKKEMNENIATINKLMHENCDLKILEQELTAKLSDVEVTSISLENINKENVVCIENLEQVIGKLNHVITENRKKELEMTNIHENLLKQITNLENDIHAKDDYISSLNQKDKEAVHNIQIAKTAIQKLKDILTILTGEIQEVPEFIDNFVNIFNVFSDNLSILETLAADIVAQKDEAVNKNIRLQTALETVVDKQNSEISELQTQLEELNKSKGNEVTQNKLLTQQILQLNEELKENRNQYDAQLSQIDKLKVDLVQHIECNQKLCKEIVSKENLIQSLNAKEKHLSATIESQQASFDEELQAKEEAIATMEFRLKELEYMLEEKSSELERNINKLNDVQLGRDKLLNDILKKASDVTDNFNIENNLSCEFKDNYVNVYERILLTLDKIANHITFINMKNVDCEHENITEILSEAQKQITHLSEQNLQLTSEMFNLDSKNSELSCELDKIKSDNRFLNEHLVCSQEILQNVKNELKKKSSEIVSMEDKVRDWKDQFTTMDIFMKQQMHELHLENEYLKAQRSDIKNYETECSDDDVKSNRHSYINTAEIISPPSLLTMCCEKIINCIQSNESDSNTTPSSSDTIIEVKNDSVQVTKCQCNVLSQELKSAREENSRIMNVLVELEIINQNLVKEQDEAHKEIIKLLEIERELHKKIVNHKTNLSILTATTFAENKSLKSQVKVLQHHHSRFHNVCQRDIPDFKKQLRELMSILNGNICICDTQNSSFKRYSLPDVLDSSTAVPNFKNESTLDGDILMLDTNITLTTAADNTLLGPDQSCLDMTQPFYNEASCQTIETATNETEAVHDQNIQAQIEILSNDNRNMFEELKLMKVANEKLRDQVTMKGSMIDAQNSPVKNQSFTGFDEEYKCSECAKLRESHLVQERLEAESKSLSQELLELKSQKTEIELKYKNLILEIPSTEALVRKLNILEKDYSNKVQEFNRLNETLSIKNKEIKRLQEENDSLSTQLFDNVSESDDLNKQLENLKHKNAELIDKYNNLEQTSKELNICFECIKKDELIQTTQLNITKAKLNRSLSDSDSSSRYNKICTLQNELHAGREDCKELTEDVVTIKNHLDRSNISMDLDESMGDSSVFTFANDFRIASPQSSKCKMPDIPEERHLDMYILDKRECLNFYWEKTGIETGNIGHRVKSIDIMKLLYENLTKKHSDEVEQQSKKLNEYCNAKIQLQKEIDNARNEYFQLSKEIEEKHQYYLSIVTLVSQIKSNVESMKQEVNASDTDKNTELINKFKDNFLKCLDKEMGLSSVSIFESLIDNIVNTNRTHLTDIMDQYKRLQNHMENVTTQLEEAKENISHMKCKLLDKETEYNLLKAQNENIQEINNTVTLEIVKRTEDLHDTMTKGYQRLIELDILTPNTLDLNLPVTTNINVLFDQFINRSRVNTNVSQETEDLRTELTKLKLNLENKDKEMTMLKTMHDKLQNINTNVTRDVMDKDNKIQALKDMHEELNQVYESKVNENKSNIMLIEKMTEEINFLKSTISDKAKTIENLETEIHCFKQNKEQADAILELLETIKDENANLKSINESIVKEKDTYALELQKSADTIKQNNIELDRMTSDILALRETVRSNTLIIDNMKKEAETLMNENIKIKEDFEAKCRECARLETNIKTHEKTAEIQTRIINRLEKQKNEDDRSAMERNKQLEELSQRCTTLQTECGALQSTIKSCRDENEDLRSTKEALETRIADLEAAVERQRPRSSLDAIADSSRRRRQSMHDSKRLFAEDKHDNDDHSHGEAIFGSRGKPEDMFMDVDEEYSDRSTPIRLSRGRDSLSASRTEQSDKDEEHSRPSSVVAIRRRRQSSHDLHRSVRRPTPEPHDLYAARLTHGIADTNHRTSTDSEVSELKHRLIVCQQELEDLKEKYRELDEECETCATYLRERDEQCGRLKKENTALQATMAELKQKLQSNPNLSQGVDSKRSVAHAAVNTDEDWTNLHSVVVDRMSYDAEVEKNKRLTKIIEELRFTKQDLKNTIAKMQRALERYSGNRELETTKKELQASKQELQQLRERYKELDEECETCAQYLREREEQCRKLMNVKTSLEAKLQEYQQEGSNVTHSSRKKRQCLHDQNRDSAVDVTDAATETTDFLTYQVERDDNLRIIEDKQAKEIKRLKTAVEKLSSQKAALEQQLASQPAATQYVATGSAIIQNQQLTDVMKENQKLKKINAKLVNICKKRGKDSNRENEEPANQC